MSHAPIDGFSRVIELHEAAFDPTYGDTEPGIFNVRICHRCGSLVDNAATDDHARHHLASM